MTPNATAVEFAQLFSVRFIAWLGGGSPEVLAEKQQNAALVVHVTEPEQRRVSCLVVVGLDLMRRPDPVDPADLACANHLEGLVLGTG